MLFGERDTEIEYTIRVKFTQYKSVKELKHPEKKPDGEEPVEEEKATPKEPEKTK